MAKSRQLQQRECDRRRCKCSLAADRRDKRDRYVAFTVVVAHKIP